MLNSETNTWPPRNNWMPYSTRRRLSVASFDPYTRKFYPKSHNGLSWRDPEIGYPCLLQGVLRVLTGEVEVPVHDVRSRSAVLGRDCGLTHWAVEPSTVGAGAVQFVRPMLVLGLNILRNCLLV